MITLTARFKNSGTPQTGLSATVTVWKIEKGVKTVEVSDKAMIDQGDGVYTYDFSGGVLNDYIALFDAGTDTTDQRYLETAFSGFSDLINNMPRSGGVIGKTMGLSPEDLDKIGEAVKGNFSELVKGLKVETKGAKGTTIQMKGVEDGVKKHMDKLAKRAEKNEKEIRTLIDKKITEIKNPEIKTEVVDLNALERNLKAELTQSITKIAKEQGNANTEEVEDVLVDFIKVFRKDLEKTRDLMKAEVEAEVMEEFKNKLNL